jgi:hypothetical protein
MHKADERGLQHPTAALALSFVKIQHFLANSGKTVAFRDAWR